MPARAGRGLGASPDLVLWRSIDRSPMGFRADPSWWRAGVDLGLASLPISNAFVDRSRVQTLELSSGPATVAGRRGALLPCPLDLFCDWWCEFLGEAAALPRLPLQMATVSGRQGVA
jgi:hypothetical protein